MKPGRPGDADRVIAMARTAADPADLADLSGLRTGGAAPAN
ncbi:Uncharacterised protein [Amycolatopsis camponoti]|uniref:Uncharacterized protein n=1 Tax=Amycolatopsis camponoti TaxID=2606593 RepID=A0A6I8M0B8_9PSEU|nr:hypothetical protein [Amycolatopsis camponoti]VVJ22138.1 Uncharacterised protein [Amycolatopsis camponoti]